MNRGFTVVEVLITLVIMTVLLALGTIGIRGSLANARDAERRSDIETIARGLEIRYKKGNSYSWDGGSASATHPAGSYPGNEEMWNWLWYRRTGAAQVAPGTSEAAIKTPSGSGINSICFFYWTPEVVPNCDSIERDANIQGFFSDGNGGWTDRYMYEFIGPDNKYCVSGCTGYNLYWISETDKTVYKGIPGLKVWRSKHR